MVETIRLFSASARAKSALLMLLLLYMLVIWIPAKGAVEGDYDVKRGERYFKGLLPFNREHTACASCHNLTPSDTLNWNPSAWEISVKYAGRDFESFRSVVMEPMGVKMALVHQNFQIEEADLKNMKAYLDKIALQGPTNTRPTFFNLMLFLLLGVLITWALLELIFIRKIRYRFIPVVVFLGAFGWQARMVIEEAIRLGRQESYAPDQPVKFSHAVHAGEQGIDCMYCHTTAEHSKSAGIPATNLCLNCHTLVREGSNSGRFEISKIIEAAEKGMNLEWIRIHNLPEHVFFSHAVHVGSGKLDCNQCHGPVEEMHVMRQHADLSMGWCVNCHRDTRVDFVDNGYYETYIKLHEQLRTGKIDTIRAEHIGANDCMSCHY
jgi:cytochrome c553